MTLAPRVWHRLFNRMPRVGILFVCAANVCRSPMAEQVLRTCAEQRRQGVAPRFRLHVESAGVRAARRAEPPDARALAALQRRGYTWQRRLSSRALTAADFERFDLLVAMDGDVLAAMHEQALSTQRHKLKRLLDYAPGLEGQDVPDPYWGGQGGFEHVLDLCEAAAPGVLAAAESCLESTSDVCEE
jgi:protein-tyrosine phosphatase